LRTQAVKRNKTDWFSVALSYHIYTKGENKKTMSIGADLFLGIATNLAYDLFTAGAGRLQQTTLGEPQQQELRACYEAAFTAMLQSVGDGLGRDELDLVGDIFRDYVQQPAVSEPLLDLALSDQPPDLAQLAQAFDALDFDRSTLPVDFDAVLRAFHTGLTEALLQRARQSDNPLYNTVSLGRLETILSLLRDLHQSNAEIRHRLGIDRPREEVAKEIEARIAATPRGMMFEAGGLCAGYSLHPAPDQFFVGHETSAEKVEDLRESLSQGFANTQLTPCTADQGVRAGHRLCNIAAQIQTTRFCIFDLPEQPDRNVYLELGIAIGLGRPFVLTRSENAAIPSLVQGVELLEFSSYSGLRRRLKNQAQVGQFLPLKTPEAPPDRGDYYYIADGEFEQDDFREAITNALYNYAVQRAELYEGGGESQMLLTSLVGTIKAARFGIYRIDEQASANTFLALGIAIGLGRPWLLVAREGHRVPLDVRGLSIFNFRSFNQVEREFVNRYRSFLDRYATR
jgi:hypothetical protein